jgi:predicted dehydrogenase
MPHISVDEMPFLESSTALQKDPLPISGHIPILPCLAHDNSLQLVKKSPPRFLLVGVGPFAMRSYLPRLKSLEESGRASLVAAVDLEANRLSLECYRRSTCPTTEFLYVAPFTTKMPQSVAFTLTDLVRRLCISCVIISTEPLAHRVYGIWALELGLNIIMDKPISTREWVVSNLDEAKGIADDFQTLVKLYNDLQKNQKTMFLVNSHRRYHFGFQEAVEKIRDVQDTTGCPVTSIYTAHCDGQWRLPTEIIRLGYHGYNRGYGKVSHSGYHGIDCVYQFLRAGIGRNKHPDRVDVISSFVQPHGAFFQLNEEDYKALFGKEAYGEASGFTPEELHKETRDFGEIDASIQLTFYHANDVVALVHLDLQHTGFGCRTWLQPGADLYKGNGRARHEMHEIKSGPLQTVIIDSRQASDKHDILRPDHSDLGGNGHFDLKVFRNAGLLGQKEVMTVTKLEDLVEAKGNDYPGYTRKVKYAAIDEAVEFMEGSITIEDLRSNLPDHEIPAHIMSGIYLSHGRRRHGLDPVVSLDLSFENGKQSHQVSLR